MLQQLLKQGILRRSTEGRLEPAHREPCQPAAAGFFDSLKKSGGTWSASGWALEPNTKQPCLYALPLQNGTVPDSLVFRRVFRPDVNEHFRLDTRTATGFSLSFHPHPDKGPVTLLALLPSGALVILPGPNQVSPEHEHRETILTEVTNPEPDREKVLADKLYAFPPDSPFGGIYSFDARFDSQSIGGVTEQFFEEAAVYHRKYTEHTRWKRLLLQALSQAGVNPAEKLPRSVWDIGCGSGNTTLPLLEMLPNSQIIATDISPQLLALLRDQIQNPADCSRLRLIAADAGQHHFREGAFDLIVGAAILHHLTDPSHAVSACYRSLKPGGHAVFFEAFEQGFVLLRLFYEQLLERRSELNLTEQVLSVLKLIIADTDVRVGSDKSDEIYEAIDDKWLFTGAYFERLREQFGFSGLQIHPLEPSSSPFSRQLKNHLRLCLNAGEEAVSPLGWEYVRSFERKMSDDFRSELLVEACIILTK